MRRFHNPKFAPESLERKLSPSGFVPVAAHVYVPTQGHATHVSSTHVGSTHVAVSTGHGSTRVAMLTPDAEPGDPPIDTPMIPSGPSLPA